MASILTTISYSALLSHDAFRDALYREIDMLRGITVYQSPNTADTLISWELSEFDPYFVHEDF